MTTTIITKEATPEKFNQKTNDISKKERRDIRITFRTKIMAMMRTKRPSLRKDLLGTEHLHPGVNPPRSSQQLPPSLMLRHGLLFTNVWLG